MNQQDPRDSISSRLPPDFCSQTFAVAEARGVSLSSIQKSLCSALLEASTLSIGSQQFVETLARTASADRASLGICEGTSIRLIAGSNLDTEQFSSEYGQLLRGAMEESFDQGISLSWPLYSADFSPILLEHELLGRYLNGVVATLPLGIHGQRIAVVCLERHIDEPFSATELRLFEQMLALSAPALKWIQLAAEPWYRRAWLDFVRLWENLRRPGNRLARRGLMGAALSVALLILLPLNDEVSGRARIEGEEQRLVASPSDGFIKAAHVRPGDMVKTGDSLVDLIEADLRLEHDRWRNQLVQHENAYAAAMARNDRVGAATSMARVSEAQAQLALLEGQLERGRITAPFNALVVAGDLSQSVGAPVHQGDTLLTLASSGRQRVVIDVDEVDIARVQPGQSGQLSLSSLPWSDDDLVVERIAPLAKAVNGRNIFEVEARLVSPRNDIRPGLLGRAEIVVGRTPVLWAWTRQILLRLRVAAWTWLG